MAKNRRAAAFPFVGLQWCYGCLAAILLGHSYRAFAATCTTNLKTDADVTIFNGSTPQCMESQFPSAATPGNRLIVWSLKNSTTNFVSIVVAAPLVAMQWVGLGFSDSGQMPGSTAVVATLGVTGAAQVEQYYLKNKVMSQVIKDTTRLILTKPMQAFYNATTKTVYMTMEVDFATSKVVPNFLLYAQGPASGDGSVIQIHQDQNQLELQADSQFPVGGVVGESAGSKLEKKVKTHGALQVFGWGVLLPIGAMVARYARNFDPAWFYIHITFQIIGFIFIIAGVALGVSLAQDIYVPGLTGHKGLGLFLFVLAILQVLAVVLRPKKDANVRKYWNWYHWWVGRLALFLACINIFVGLGLAKAESKLKVSYIVLLAFEIVAFAILETLLWMRWNRDPGTSSGARWNRSSTNQDFQMSDY